MSYPLAALVDDLRGHYREKASDQAIALMIEALRRGMEKERDVFTSAAILLCRGAKAERPVR